MIGTEVVLDADLDQVAMRSPVQARRAEFPYATCGLWRLTNQPQYLVAKSFVQVWADGAQETSRYPHNISQVVPVWNSSAPALYLFCSCLIGSR